MEKHVCNVCNYTYDPAVGDIESGIEPGTSFDDLPESWRCPICGESRAAFDVVESPEAVTTMD